MVAPSYGCPFLWLPLLMVAPSYGCPFLWLPLRYWLIDKYQKIYASVLTNTNNKCDGDESPTTNTNNKSDGD